MVQKYTSGKGKKIAKYTQKILNKNDQELVIHKSSILSRHTSNLLGRNPDEVSRKELFLASHKIVSLISVSINLNFFRLHPPPRRYMMLPQFRQLL